MDSLSLMRPDIDVRLASYGTGAGVFRAADKPVIVLDVPDNPDIWQITASAYALIQTLQPTLVVAHEEPAALVAAKLLRKATLYLSAWLVPPADDDYRRHMDAYVFAVYGDALSYADDIAVMEHPGLFLELENIRGRVHYLGPVVRQFAYTPADRARARRELGLGLTDIVILTVEGSWDEARAPIADRVLSAFDLLDAVPKHLIWVAGQDADEVTRKAAGRSDVQIRPRDWQLDRLMVAADVAITKGTYRVSKELFVLGVPSIALSYQLNWMDDFRVKRLAAWLDATTATPQSLATELQRALHAPPLSPDHETLAGAGARRAASLLAERLDACLTRA
jgi:predicted glycosyltransferase